MATREIILWNGVSSQNRPKLIRMARERMGLYLSHLSELSGYSSGHLSKLENGSARLTKGAFLKIMKALHDYEAEQIGLKEARDG